MIWMSTFRKMTVAAVGFALSAATAVAEDREIGYVESFDGNPNLYRILRGDDSLPVLVMSPLVKGDRVEVRDPAGKIVIRILGLKSPLVISQGNLDTPLTFDPPKRRIWTPLIAWASAQISAFDEKDREQISASIRAPSNSGSVPMLEINQVVREGPGIIALAWPGQRDGVVTMTDPSGRQTYLGTGKGWYAGSAGELQQGNHVIDVAIGQRHFRRAVRVEPESSFPSPPKEFLDEELDPDLKEVTLAAWLCARDRKYMMESLRRVAPLVDRYEPARLLAGAIAKGMRPQLFQQ